MYIRLEGNFTVAEHNVVETLLSVNYEMNTIFDCGLDTLVKKLQVV